MQPQEQIRSCKQVDLNHINEMRETETCHFRLFPYEQEQDVGYHGNIDLREDCILRFPEKLLYMKVLLDDGLEEEFDLPSFLVEPGDELCRMLLHVREDFDGFPRLRVS